MRFNYEYNCECESHYGECVTVWASECVWGAYVINCVIERCTECGQEVDT